MATTPQFIQQRLARKSSDITRLTSQYKNQINAMTGEYEKSYADYTAKRNEIMAPYEAAVGQYQQQFTGYEEALAGYKQRLADYQARLQDVYDRPLEEMPVKLIGMGRGGMAFDLNGQRYMANSVKWGYQTLPDGYTFDTNTNKLYKERSAGKFEEKAPTAPTLPTAPVVEEFDTKQFDAKRAELDMGLKRELGERKAAKVNAVGRKQARPLLQGA